VLLRKFGLPVGALDTVVYIRGEKYFLRSTATLWLLRDIGGAWSLFYGLMIIPGLIRDLVYKIVAKTRYAVFGRSHSCVISSSESRKEIYKSNKSKIPKWDTD